MKVIISIVCTFLLLSSYAKTGRGGDYCVIQQKAATSDFYCYVKESDRVIGKSVSPLEEYMVRRKLEDKGVKFFDKDLEFTTQLATDAFKAIAGKIIECSESEKLEKVYYQVDQFNRLPASSEAVQSVKKLARALHKAGVCNVDVKQQSFNGINISSADDVLHQFLCISNSESVFGRDNIGMGGRGPWGIHPMHNQAKGTRAFTGGKTVTLKKNGICYDYPKAIVRDGNGVERKVSSLYRDPEVQYQNARCALILYNQNGFRDWGTGQSWGSNRHCSASTRNRLEFNKHLGAELGCCTQSCKDRLRNVKQL